MIARLAAIYHELFVQLRVVPVLEQNTVEHGRIHKKAATHLTRQQIQCLDGQRAQISPGIQHLAGQTRRARIRVGEKEIRDGQNRRRLILLQHLSVLCWRLGTIGRLLTGRIQIVVARYDMITRRRQARRVLFEDFDEALKENGTIVAQSDLSRERVDSKHDLLFDLQIS